MSDAEIVAAYKVSGSIWKAAKRLGLAGQSVHERLRRLGYPLAHRKWTRAEIEEARSLSAQGEPLSRIATRLGRTTAAAALKLSRLGICSQHTGWRFKVTRRTGLTRRRIAGFAKKLDAAKMTVWRLARAEGIAITPLVDALQRYEPDVWRRYVETHSVLPIMGCPGCKRPFRPLTKRQRFCAVRCRETHHRDVQYFGGRRMRAEGLADGTCKLCNVRYDKGLSAHHVLGRENDPHHEALIALCQGCHDLLTRFAARPWVENPDSLSDLIALALARRGRTNASVWVDLEYWTNEEVRDYFKAFGRTISGQSRRESG